MGAIDQAHEALKKDIKKKETVSKIISILQENNLTIEEAISVLKAADESIMKARISHLHSH